MKHMVALVLLAVYCGCKSQTSNRQSPKPEDNRPAQTSKKPKVTEPKVNISRGMLAAKRAYNAGQYAHAVSLLEVELFLEEADSMPSWIQFSYLNSALGLALHHAGKHDKALEYHQKSLAIRLKQLGVNDSHVATSYNNIGLVHHAKGKYAKALGYLQKSLPVRLEQLGAGHTDVATSYNNMAYVLDAQGKVKEARENMEKAYSTRKKVLGDEHPRTKDNAEALKELEEGQSICVDQLLRSGEKQLDQAQCKRAMDLFARALSLAEVRGSKDHTQVAICYNNIGTVHYREGKYAKALGYLQKSLAIRLKQLGPGHPGVSASYNNIGDVHHRKGDYDKALEYLRKSRAIMLKQVGADHPGVAAIYNNIGGVQESKGEHAKALEY